MPRIRVVKSFLLTHAAGATRKFDAGVHDVEAEIAKHWYVQAHSEPAEDPKPEPKPALKKGK